MDFNIEVQEAQALFLTATKEEYATIMIGLVGTADEAPFTLNEGVHIFMAVYGLIVFLETPKPDRTGRAFYIAVSFIITALSALCAALNAVLVYDNLMKAQSGTDYAITLLEQTGSGYPLRILSNCVLRSFISVGDALMVYRCMIIWRESVWVTILPALTCIGAFSAGLGANVQKYRYSNIQTLNNLDLVATCLTVVTNTMVTALIIFYIRRERQVLFKLQTAPLDMKVYTGAIALVVESALPLTISGLLLIATSIQSNQSFGLKASMIAAQMLAPVSFLFYALCSLSPHLIIFRVTMGRSWVKRFPRSGAGEGVSAPIDFAHRSTSDNDDSVSGMRANGV
ncbi:hypothetical protein MD484_g7796, partial [Candolleomyces efflorescens]